ncbi:cytochrome P450 94C1-like [Panicum virgatum]|uniref:cytochrome P450 94C1-like n=1 Tax=Panicum virgatum TaxID=38727 RepID=UPI0019D53BE8|nr:cytochrome P450 94C1-like [Panicum virgatum]
MKRLLNIGFERELKKAIKLVDELAVAIFLLAGRDTVSSALFMLLSKNPDVAAAIRAEAGHDSTPVTYEHLHYTHAVLYENMRLFPPVQFDSKFCTAADVLPDGTYVSGGARVMYHPYAMGRTPRLWGADHEAQADEDDVPTQTKGT